jgi:microcin C transport system permease protein
VITPGKILDYFWHMTCRSPPWRSAAFATTTLLTKNSFLDEIRKQYVHHGAHEGAANGRCSTATSSATPC